jgi:serine/threonine-protein kinase
MARERSILAALEHPHIARLYGAGIADDGQPYLALEYVEGISIDEYCRSNSCTLEKRLQLFLQVADAVAAAHARLIVHRDLKPANILVTHDGYVRLLDFGVAKLLDDAARPDARGLTQLSVHALTPDFAAPEQILGEPVTIAADIYSLGVVLFELLTGERPYRLRRETRGALEDAILQVEPRRPSDTASPFARALRGDLDTIVLKALHKKPADRYATMNAFADDVRRYLERRPVLARPDSAWYRASRFLQRNRLAVLAAALAGIAVLVGAASATVGLLRARAAERRALAEAQTSREVARFLVDLFKVSDPGEARGNTVTAREILDRASRRVTTELEAAPEVRGELLFTMADVYAKLGLHKDALGLARAGLELRRAEGDSSRLAASLNQVGEILTFLGQGADAVPLLEQALELLRGKAPPDHARIAGTQRKIANVYYAQARYDDAMALLLAARTEIGRAPRTDREQLAEILKDTATVHSAQGKFQEAAAADSAALVEFRAALGEDHPKVAGTLGDLAIALKDMQQYEDAEKAYLESLAIQRRVLGPGHPDVGNALNNLAVMYAERGMHEKALATAREGMEILRIAVGEEHDLTLVARLNAARSLVQLDQLELAEKEMRAILEIRQRQGDRFAIGYMSDALADALNRQEKFAEGLIYARVARTELEAALGRDHWRWATVGRTLGMSLTGLKQYPEAQTVLLESYDLLLSKRGPTHRVTLLAAQRLAELYQAWGLSRDAQIWLARSQLKPE